jgi:hypothetical protein
LQSWKEDIDLQPVVEVEMTSLSTADSPRSSGENPDHVEALAVAAEPLPPIVVHRATMRVIDGLHRLRAAQSRGLTAIPVRFFDGPAEDAFVLAVESNTTHGLPLSKADRKRAATRIIASHPRWSDRKIASVAGLAPSTVAEIRRRMPASAAADGARVGQDGRVRPVNGAEGRRLAGELIMKNPDLSLRQVAKVVGISPETVRDVRGRLLRGEDPLPPPRARARASVAGTGRSREVALAGHRPAVARVPVQDRTTLVDRLKADPALRLSETGRTLLRMLNLHTISPKEWEEVIDNIPPHCSGIVAHLASECAGMWSEFAVRVGRKMPETA